MNIWNNLRKICFTIQHIKNMGYINEKKVGILECIECPSDNKTNKKKECYNANFKKVGGQQSFDLHQGLEELFGVGMCGCMHMPKKDCNLIMVDEMTTCAKMLWLWLWLWL